MSRTSDRLNRIQKWWSLNCCFPFHFCIFFRLFRCLCVVLDRVLCRCAKINLNSSIKKYEGSQKMRENKSKTNEQRKNTRDEQMLNVRNDFLLRTGWPVIAHTSFVHIAQCSSHLMLLGCSTFRRSVACKKKKCLTNSISRRHFFMIFLSSSSSAPLSSVADNFATFANWVISTAVAVAVARKKNTTTSVICTRQQQPATRKKLSEKRTEKFVRFHLRLFCLAIDWALCESCDADQT